MYEYKIWKTGKVTLSNDVSQALGLSCVCDDKDVTQNGAV